MNACPKFVTAALAVVTAAHGTSMGGLGNRSALSASPPNARTRVGMTLERFVLVSPLDVYGRFATPLMGLEGTLSLGSVFGSGLDALRDAPTSSGAVQPASSQSRP